MSEVFNFEDEKQKRTPHFQGRAKCLDCKHEWQAVWPKEAGIIDLECPSCGMVKGLPVGTVRPQDDAKIFVCLRCDTGCVHFHITSEWKAFCCYCGFEHDLNDV